MELRKRPFKETITKYDLFVAIVAKDDWNI